MLYIAKNIFCAVGSNMSDRNFLWNRIYTRSILKSDKKLATGVSSKRSQNNDCTSSSLQKKISRACCCMSNSFVRLDKLPIFLLHFHTRDSPACYKKTKYETSVPDDINIPNWRHPPYKFHSTQQYQRTYESFIACP